MKIERSSLLHRYMSTDIELFGVVWDTNTISRVESGMSIWLLLIWLIAQTVLMLFVPAIYVLVLTVMLTPLCIAVGLVAGYVILPNAVGFVVICGLLLPNVLTFVIWNCDTGQLQIGYWRNAASVIVNVVRALISLEWVNRLGKVTFLPLVFVFRFLGRVARWISNPVKIEIDTDEDD